MPHGTKVEEVYQALRREGKSEEDAAKIAQAQTGQSLATGEVVKNQRFVNTFSVVPKWRKTPDGFLRCKARIIAESIMPYSKAELKGVPESFHNPIVNMLISCDEIGDEESLKTLEGAPVIAGTHNWLDPNNATSFVVGSVSGIPTMNGRYLECDLLITDGPTISKIENRELQEISAGYYCDTLFTNGNFRDKEYHAEQKALRYNHIAILPPGMGRGGNEVRIINKKGITPMSEITQVTKIKVQLTNSNQSVALDEVTANLIQGEMKAMDEIVNGYKSQLTEAGQKIANADAEKSELKAQLENAKGEAAAFKAEVEKLQNADAINNAAKAMLAEKTQAATILNSMDDDADDKEKKEKKEEIKNSVEALFGHDLRTKVLNAIGVDTASMSENEVKGAFNAQYQICNAKPKKVVAGASMTAPTQQVVNAAAGTAGRTALQRLGF